MIKFANRLNDVGEYYFSKKLDEVRAMKLKGLDVINLGIGSPDLAPSPETIQKTIQCLKLPTSHAYQSYRSTPELRGAIAKFYQNTYGVNVDPATEVLPLLGSKEGILFVTLAFANPGEKVLIPDPGYPAYTSVNKMLGVQVETYDILEKNNWLPDLKALESRDLKNTKIMWVNYPHMPTGGRADRKFFGELIAFAQKHQILVVNDNPYSLMLNTEAPLSLLSIPGAKETALELNSLSKSFNMAGWRVGMAVGHKSFIDAIIQMKSNVDTGMFLPIQEGAAQALSNSKEWHDERNSVYRERRDIIYKMMDHMKCVYDPKQVGLFVWARLPSHIKDSGKFIDSILLEQNVFFTPGFIFGKNGEGYIRSSLCAPVEILREALKRLEKRDFGGGQ